MKKIVNLLFFVIFITANFSVHAQQKTNGTISQNLQKQTNEVDATLEEYIKWVETGEIPQSIAGNLETTDDAGRLAGRNAHLNALVNTYNDMSEIKETATLQNVLDIFKKYKSNLKIMRVDFGTQSGNVLSLGWDNDKWTDGKWVKIQSVGVRNCIGYVFPTGTYPTAFQSCFNNLGKTLVSAIKDGTAKVVSTTPTTPIKNIVDVDTDVDTADPVLTDEDEKEVREAIEKALSAHSAGGINIINVNIAKTGSSSAKSGASATGGTNTNTLGGEGLSGDLMTIPNQGGIGSPGKIRNYLPTNQTTSYNPPANNVGTTNIGTTNTSAAPAVVNNGLSDAQFNALLSEMKKARRAARWGIFLGVANMALNIHQSVRLEQFWRQDLGGQGGRFQGGKFVPNGTGGIVGGNTGGGFTANGTGFIR